MAKVKMGRIIRKANTARNFGSDTVYNWLWVEDENGTNERLLAFTDSELLRMQKRAENNPEDAPKRSFFTDMMD